MNNSDDYIVATTSFMLLVSILIIQGCSYINDDKATKLTIDCSECKVKYETDKEVVDKVLIKGF